MKFKVLTFVAFLLVVLVFMAPANATATVYVNADNGAGTILFGSLSMKVPDRATAINRHCRS